MDIYTYNININDLMSVEKNRGRNTIADDTNGTTYYYRYYYWALKQTARQLTARAPNTH